MGNMQYARRISQNFSKRNSKVDIQPNPEKQLFKSIVDDPKSKRQLILYLQRVDKTELFFFYENVTTFRKTLRQLELDKVAMVQDKLKQAASPIIESYIREQAGMPIPLEPPVRLEILQRYKDGDIKSDLFDEALDDHMDRLTTLVTQDFMNSEEGQKYVDQQFSEFKDF